jgi:tight adherence protein B
MSVLIQALLGLGVAVVVGFAIALTLMEVREARLARERHMGLVVRKEVVPVDKLALAERKNASWLGVLGQQLRRIFAVGLPRRWGMRAGAPALLIAALLGGAAAWFGLTAGLHMGNWISIPVTLGLCFLAPRTLLKRQQGKADKAFMEVFPETIEMIVRMLRAGLPITGAVRAVGSEAPPPVDAVFTRIADEMAIGIPFEDALATAGHYIGLSDFQFFSVAVALQRATGGNLTQTLKILSDIMRKRRAMRLKARATTGEVRMSAYVLGAIPFVVLGGLLLMTPEYLAPLLADRRGNILIATAVIMLLAGFGTIRQMMRSVTSAT